MVSSAAGGCLHPTRPSLLPRGWAEPLGRAGQARGVRRLLRALGTLAVSAWWQHVPRRAELRGTLCWHRCHSVSVLQKLPFTIPELVQSSPCRSSDGVLYTGTRAPPQGPPGVRWGGGPAEQLQGRRGARGPGGVRHGVDVLLFAGKKQDTWFVVDPKSGEKQTTLSTEASDGLCPSSPLLYIGRTRKPALLCCVPVLGCPPAPWGPGLPREAGAPQQPAPLLGSVTPTCRGWAGPAAFPPLPLPTARCDPVALLSPQSTSSPCTTPSRGSCAGTPPTPTTQHRSARSPTPTVSRCSPLAGTCGSRPCWSPGKVAAGSDVPCRGSSAWQRRGHGSVPSGTRPSGMAGPAWPGDGHRAPWSTPWVAAGRVGSPRSAPAWQPAAPAPSVPGQRCHTSPPAGTGWW